MTTTFQFWAENFPQMLAGLGVSVQLTLLSLLLGLPLGLLLALGVTAPPRPLRWLSIGLVETGRGAPALVILYVVYFGLPILHWTPEALVSAVIGLTFTTAAYTGEYIRGGLKAVSPGSIEAAHALAMPTTDVLRFIVIPQGMRVALPSLMGFAVQIFQATSLTYSITVSELTAQAYGISSMTFRSLEIFGLAGLMYAAITVPSSWLTSRVERRLSLRH
ncbi:amino acid ABC transporter permease [Raineyella sp. W15-4]|uniref:amino acid ABC transporter permease n=1 Tax=Raineyella sp. W15-4 TaxID=3081651 RepID=UPI002955AFEB|nr:amino acid ABC transporter permease [Raineyella sp. W15-4]WOQ15741.1 amino acid ABC transporter permease [Raineyella sp. W15-4]